MDKKKYRDLCKDMMKICKKYAIVIRASNDDIVYINESTAKTSRDAAYQFKFDANNAEIVFPECMICIKNN